MNAKTTEEIAEVFGRNLKSAMEKRNVTGYWLSKETGIDHRSIYRIIKGDQLPAVDTLVLIARALKIQPSSLLRGF